MSKRLTAAERTAKKTLEAYKAIRQVKEGTQQKLDALLDMPFYKVFDFDEKHKHPYHTLNLFNTIDSGMRREKHMVDWFVEG